MSSITSIIFISPVGVEDIYLAFPLHFTLRVVLQEDTCGDFLYSFCDIETPGHLNELLSIVILT